MLPSYDYVKIKVLAYSNWWKFIYLWCGNWALSELYPNLYLITKNKGASMSSMVSVGGEDGLCYL